VTFRRARRSFAPDFVRDLLTRVSGAPDVTVMVVLERHRRLHLPDSYFFDFAAAHFLARPSERRVNEK
jgi:hypothetical protein